METIKKNINTATKGWETAKSKLSNEYYDINKTIILLKTDDYYLRLLGKAKNRTLMKENPILYNSIYFHTKCLDELTVNQNKFSMRILFLVKSNGNINNIKCKICGENIPTFNYSIGYYNDICLNCFHTKKVKYPTINWFKSKYGDDWEVYYKIDRQNIKNKKVGSLSWYKKKYGDILGEEKYKEITYQRVNNIINLKQMSYSKISQEIFWEIYNQLNEDEKKDCYFKELNYEYIIILNNIYFFPDFKYKNKVIEYDGIYWHEKRIKKDNIRNDVYRKNNIDYLIINENDYCRNNKNNNTIIKCLKFIRNEN